MGKQLFNKPYDFMQHENIKHMEENVERAFVAAEKIRIAEKDRAEKIRIAEENTTSIENSQRGIPKGRSKEETG